MSDLNFKRLGTWVVVFIGVLILFFTIKTINEIKEFKYIGSDSISENNSISITGKGEVFATADIANFSFSVIESGKTVNEAEKTATSKWNEILTYLTKEGVEKKDVKTTNYSIDPQYAPQNPNVSYVPLDQRQITGYTVTQSASVKVRDTEKTGDIVSTVGGYGVRNISGISFTIDDEETLKDEARILAIKDAKEKAGDLAKSLGVSLGQVIGFYESEGPTPYYANREEEGGFNMKAMAMDSVAPEVPMGENRIVVNVEVMFRIK